MTKRMIVPLIFGVLGTAILIGLGTWQLQRLAWKEGVLADIDARIAADPVPLPAAPAAEADRYLPVTVTGRAAGDSLHVLASVKRVGAVYRVISPFETEGGRRVMVDRGYVLSADKASIRPPEGAVTVSGNLHWPDETDGFTPEADLAENIWFARDVPAMAAALGTEPVLVIARATTPPDPVATPLPVDSSGIPNDHLEYAITWFSLAVVWAGMTAFLLWRIRRRTV